MAGKILKKKNSNCLKVKHFNIQDRKDAEFSSDSGENVHLYLYSILSERSSDNNYQVHLPDDCQDFLHYNNTMVGYYFSCEELKYSNLSVCEKWVFCGYLQAAKSIYSEIKKNSLKYLDFIFCHLKSSLKWWVKYDLKLWSICFLVKDLVENK